MKATATLFLITLCSVCFSQNYQPFSSTSSKRFFESGNPSNNDFFFHSTNETTIGDTVVIDQYHMLFDNGIFDDIPECISFWGGSVGVELDTTWLGNQLKWNFVTKELYLENEFIEPLSFDFSLSLGSSASFYSNSNLEYRIEHTSNGIETFHGITDSIQYFEIQAFDATGNSISSPLNNVNIKLSKNYGLLSFINCYQFPISEQAMELEGQTNPSFGHYQLTYDQCYPWIVGDVIQYRTNNSFNGSFPANKIAYQTITVTNRTETADSVKIYMSSILQEAYPPLAVPPFSIPTGQIMFKKGTNVSNRPWNMSQLDNKLSRGSEYSLSWCGGVESFKWEEEFSHYCDSCKCYGGYDGVSQSVETRHYAEGIGIYELGDYDYGYPINGGSRTALLIYSNIHGVECGTLWNEDEELFQFDFSVSPNPTNDILRVESDKMMDQIRIIDLSGRTLQTFDKINQKSTEISLVSLQKGAYILEISSNGLIQTQTIIRE